MLHSLAEKLHLHFAWVYTSMALINCPFCQQRISNRAVFCSKCSRELTGDLTSEIRVTQIRKASSLMTQSFSFLTLFVVGVVIWFWHGEIPEDIYGIRGWIAGGCFVLGFVCYILTRMRVILHKRKG